MSRTDLDATTLADSLRMSAGDGSIELVSEPIQASVLLDIADMLDENTKLRELAVSYDSALRRMCDQMQRYVDCHDCILGKDYDNEDSCAIDELREAACVVKVELE